MSRFISEKIQDRAAVPAVSAPAHDGRPATWNVYYRCEPLDGSKQTQVERW